jgi:16S rRNA G966 N2-methylase RsmD
MSIKIVDIKTVKPNPSNPRYIKDHKFTQLVKSIRNFPEMLQLRPIVVDTDNIVLGGNMRLKACIEAGLKEVPIIVASELTEEQQKEFIIKDNVGFGEWDWEQLANEWEIEQLSDWGLDLPIEMEDTEIEAVEDNYQAPDTIETDIVIGDLFEIGEHRLLCGDSTDSDAVAKLMNGEKADMVFTDPPYGISHSGKGITAPTKSGKIVEGNDFGEILGDGDVNAAIDSFNLIYSLYPEALHIWWGANYYSSILPNGYGWLVWDKERVGDTFSGAELAFVNKGVKVNVFRHMWHGIAKASESGDKRLHPTQKPVALVEWCFDNYQAGNLVADVFLGSGSTMVAAHQLKRKCYGMELDPKYCQVIIDRMLKLDSDLKITRNGQPYESIS